MREEGVCFSALYGRESFSEVKVAVGILVCLLFRRAAAAPAASDSAPPPTSNHRRVLVLILVVIIVILAIVAVPSPISVLGGGGEGRRGVGPRGELRGRGTRFVADFVVEIDAAEGEQDSFDVYVCVRACPRGKGGGDSQKRGGVRSRALTHTKRERNGNARPPARSSTYLAVWRSCRSWPRVRPLVPSSAPCGR